VTISLVSYCLQFAVRLKWGLKAVSAQRLGAPLGLTERYDDTRYCLEQTAELESALDGFPDRIHPHSPAPYLRCGFEVLPKFWQILGKFMAVPNGNQAKHFYAFGPFRFDSEKRVLVRDGTSVPLAPKAAEALLVLVENAGHLVDKDDLMKRVWPDAFVEEGNLNKNIFFLRKILGEWDGGRDYIETIPKRGFRFVAPVNEVTHAEGGPHSQASTGGANLLGQKVSHYRVLEIVGGGGMGLVYKAEDLKLGRRVALKFLPEDVAIDPLTLKRFEREARTASSLNHPNICTIYEFGEHAGRPFLVMELLEGETLREVISKAQASVGGEKLHLPLERLLNIAIQTNEGLDAAHQKAIIHRDIKPANVFLTSQGQVKILDFGLAKPAIAAGEVAAWEPGEDGTRGASIPITGGMPTDHNLTGTGMAIGTAGYMSPEQVRGDKLDARTDLFSFGLILYEMATGQRAFSGDTAAILKEAILNEAPVPLHELNSALPAELVSIIDKALQKDRELRYQSAAEMHADLVRLKLQEPDGVNKRFAPLVTVLGVLVIVLLVAAALWYRQQESYFPPLAREMKQRQLTTNTGDDPVSDAWISPNGKYLAYFDSKGIHVKLIDTGETRTLSEPDGLNGIDVGWGAGPWFPDSQRFLGVASVAGQRPSTWVFSLAGQPAHKLRDDAFPMDISADGSLVLFSTNAGRVGDREIWLMGSNGEHARRLYESDENTGYDGVGWLPDDRRLAYLRFHQSPDKTEQFLESRDLQGGPPTTVISSGLPWQKDGIRGFVSLPDGRLLYILTEPDLNGFTCNYWEVQIDPHTGERRSEPRRLTTWAGFCMDSPNTTADGKRLVYLRFSFQRSVQVADLDAGGTRINNSRRLTTSEGNEYPMGWTADSKAVIFHSNRNGSIGIFKQFLDRDAPEAVVMGTEDSAPVASALTPDGSSIIYTLVPKERSGSSLFPSQIMQMSVSGGVPRLLMTTVLSGPPRCAKSPATLCIIGERTPDGKQLVFTALDPTKGRGSELIRFAIDPGENYSWDLSPEGTCIAVAKQAGRQFDLLFLNGQPNHTIKVKGWDIGIGDNNAHAAMRQVEGVNFDWAADAQGLFTAGRRPHQSALLYVDLLGNVYQVREQTGSLSPTIMGMFPGPWGVPSPDGRHLAMLNWTRNSNVWMMSDF
jgi:serine/threonine protein kinase/Tol biopolymer transport system component